MFNNDVWLSTNLGISWSLSTLYASWGIRCAHQSVVIDSTIYLMGGEGNTLYNDVWKSSNLGSTWSICTSFASWSQRAYFRAVTYSSVIIVIGGYDGYYYRKF